MPVLGIEDRYKTDILLVLDATYSMDKFIKGVRSALQDLMLKLNAIF